MIRRVPFGFVLAALLLALPAIAPAQQAEDIRSLELKQLVLNPTAGTLKQGQYGIDVRAYGNGGLLTGISVGVFHRFMFGISYGGERMLGYDEFAGNDLPGVQIRYRLIEESMTLPALTLGFDMQGLGGWYPGPDRYLYKAPGAFVVLSRNFTSGLGRFGVHAGVNYNTLEASDDRAWDGWFGVDFSLNEQLVITAEYDLALDDRTADDGFGEGEYGYLNAGVRFGFAKSLALQFDLIDLLNTSAEHDGFGRALKVIYIERFNL